MHHEQDMRKMGGLRKYMPVTHITMWLGTLALVATPFFSGYYSKDAIIVAAGEHAGEGGFIAQYAYWAVLLGAFVTSFYSFRLLYLTFFGEERFRDAHGHGHDAHHDAHHDDGHGHHGAHEPHESPWVVTLPLVLLAIPSVVIGFFTAGPMLFGTDWAGHEKGAGFFDGAIFVEPARDVMAKIAAADWHGPVAFALHGFMTPAFLLALAGFALATLLYLVKPELRTGITRALAAPIRLLERKYYMDDLWIGGLAGGSVKLGRLSSLIDNRVVDGAVNGAVSLVGTVAAALRKVQTGYLYHYAFAMILGLVALLAMARYYWQ
jgi:NADH-quinone oxidoreductase subunit L